MAPAAQPSTCRARNASIRALRAVNRRFAAAQKTKNDPSSCSFDAALPRTLPYAGRPSTLDERTLSSDAAIFRWMAHQHSVSLRSNPLPHAR